MQARRWLHDHGDAILAVTLSVLFQAQLWLGVGLSVDEIDLVTTDPARRAVLALLGLAFTGSLAGRRRWPLVPLALAFPVLLISGTGGIDGLPAVVLALVATTWSVGAGTTDVRAIVGTFGVAALIAIAIGRDRDAAAFLGDALVPVLLIGGPWAAGLVTRLRREQTRALETRAAALERDREAQTRAAATAERARIAHDLHDVVAHALSIVVVQARGGRHSLGRDPEMTLTSLVAIETTAAEALAEMRRLFMVVDGGDGDGIVRAPQPGLADLERLAAQVREAGLPVEVVIEGDRRRLPPGIDLSAYRIVQEALTNTLRHAGPATARVVVRYGDADDPSLRLEVTDTGRTAASATMGRGLIGMRERAALVGGVVEAGPGAGGYVVRARLPMAGAGP